jgi:hypothetical protein
VNIPKHVKYDTPQYLAYVIGRGLGWDHTAGCNELLVPLPASIQSLGEAYKYVYCQEQPGCVRYYGADRVDRVTIFLVTDAITVNADHVRDEIELQARVSAKLEQAKAERALYEELKKKFEPQTK